MLSSQWNVKFKFTSCSNSVKFVNEMYLILFGVPTIIQRVGVQTYTHTHTHTHTGSHAHTCTYLFILLCTSYLIK